MAPTGLSVDDKAANDEVAGPGLADQQTTPPPSPLRPDRGCQRQRRPIRLVGLAITDILTLAYTISMCAARKQIKIAVAIVKESSVVLKDRPAMMFFLGTLAVQVGLLFYFILIVLFLGTASLTADHFTGAASAVSAKASYVDSIKAYNASLAAKGAAGMARGADERPLRAGRRLHLLPVLLPLDSRELQQHAGPR